MVKLGEQRRRNNIAGLVVIIWYSIEESVAVWVENVDVKMECGIDRIEIEI